MIKWKINHSIKNDFSRFGDKYRINLKLILKGNFRYYKNKIKKILLIS